jgi:hypothetical protein
VDKSKVGWPYYFPSALRSLQVMVIENQRKRNAVKAVTRAYGSVVKELFAIEL